MYIQLNHRHYGIHEPIKHAEIPVTFDEVVLGEDYIDEDLLLSKIPDGWLPTKPEQILLCVGNENGTVGQCGLAKFRNWAKYFDSYSLDLLREPLKWWDRE